MMRQFELLSTRRFAPIFITQFLGALNDNIFRFALILAITFNNSNIASSSERSDVSLIAGIFILPFLLFSGLSGQLADKFEKSKTIRATKTSEVLISILATYGFLTGNFMVLLATLFLMGVQSTVFGPLKYSILPQQLKKNELAGANGLMQTGTYAAIILGALIGATEAGTTYISITMIGVALLGRLSAQFILHGEANSPQLNLDINIVKSGCDSIAHNFKDKHLATMSILISLFWFMGSTYFTLIPIYAKDFLSALPLDISKLTLALAIGVGLGSMLCEKLSRENIDLGLISVGIVSIGLVSFEIFYLAEHATYNECIDLVGICITPINRFFIDLILLSAAGALFVIPMYASVQSHSQKEHRARVMAAINILNAILMVIASIFTFTLLKFEIAANWIFLIVASLSLVATGLGLLFVPKMFWWAREPKTN